MCPCEHRKAVPYGVRLPSKLERSVIRNRGVRGESAGHEERIHAEVLCLGAAGNHRIETAADVQEVSRRYVASQQAVGRTRASFPTVPVRCEVLLARKHRMGGKEVGGAHSCQEQPKYAFMVRILMDIGKRAGQPAC
jgi:hypothetical protein